LFKISGFRLFSFTFLALLPIVFYFVYHHEIVNKGIYFSTYILYLVFILFTIFKAQQGIFTAYNIFSAMYFGYVLGGLYYSFQVVNFGKFIGFMSLPTDKVIELFEISLLLITIGYIFFSLGHSLIISERFKVKKLASLSFEKTRFLNSLYKTRLVVISPFLILGLSNWYNVANATAGGLFESIIYFQAFRHMAEDAGVSTLFYNFYYAAIYYWLYLLIANNKKITTLFYLCAFLGMVMNLTQGQIMAPITFILSLLVFVGICRPELQKKALIGMAIMMAFAFILYFLRILSNLYFIGQELSFENIVGNFLHKIIGSGNTADIQQIAIIMHTFTISSSQLGLTYIDWLRNLFAGSLGLEPSSVGLILKNNFFPKSSGAPTPGALGELYANFYILSPFMMFFVGSVLAMIEKVFLQGKSHFNNIVYALFLMKFVFLYAKVDSTMLTSFVYAIVPLIIVVLLHTTIIKLLTLQVSQK